MIRRVLLAVAAPVVAAATLGPLVDRMAARVVRAPRRGPEEGALVPALDALGGEIVRIRARDGLRLSARWLPAEVAVEVSVGDGAWRPDPREAVVLLHGYSGSIAPDLLEYGPFLRRTTGVLGLDFRGHGDSDDSPTTFGMREVDDVAGALAWLGERGIRRVALVGTSMGGITAIASVAVLGDGRLAAADKDPDAPAAAVDTPRPELVAVVADSVTSELAIVVASRVRFPFSRFVAERTFARAARHLGGDMRATQPLRTVPLLEDVPLLLIHGTADDTVPIREGRRLAAAAPAGTRHLEFEGAGHSGAHAAEQERYEAAVTEFLREAFTAARGRALGPDDDARILSAGTPPGDASPDASDGASG